MSVQTSSISPELRARIRERARQIAQASPPLTAAQREVIRRVLR